MQKSLLVVFPLILSACGAFQIFGDRPILEREVASVAHGSLLADEVSEFDREMDQRLLSLHSYYMLGQRNLALFDEAIEESSLEDLYSSPVYFKLLAIRTQVEEIEHELLEAYEESSQSKDKEALKQKLRFIAKITAFASASSFQKRSLENLLSQMKIDIPEKSAKSFIETSLEEELDALAQSKEFLVYEKNIEHLSHMMDESTEKNDSRFYPSTTKAGNLTGNEFPAKVWSLTFDDGPGRASTARILENLKTKSLKATFFQLTKNAKAQKDMAKQIREAGMEIASHSYTHPQLTKLGSIGLEKEITQAASELEKLHDIKIKFYRLPYGAGVSSPRIRELIAAKEMIHVFWNIDTLDWMSQSPEKIVERTRSLMQKTRKDAGVILFHDIHQRTAEAAPRIMDYLKQDGRRVCTLEEIVTQMNDGVETVCPPK